MHDFDRALALRVVAAAAAGWAATAGIVVLTDEAASTVGMRLARLAALGPAATGLAVLAVSAHARARGEVSSLGALGAPPWVALRGAALGGFVGGAAAVLLLVLPWTDPSSLFPVVHRAVEWSVDPAAGSARALGVVVHASGALHLVDASTAAPPFVPGAGSALACIAPLACVVPPWGTTPMAPPVRAASLGCAAAAAIVLLHAVAAGRAPPIALVLPAAPLAAALAWGRAAA